MQEKIVVSDIDPTICSGIFSDNGTPELSIAIVKNGLQVGDSFTIKLTIDGNTKELKVYLVEVPSIWTLNLRKAIMLRNERIP